MKEINKLEEYLNERSEKRKKRNRLLAIVFLTITILGLVVGGLYFFTDILTGKGASAAAGQHSSSKETENNGDKNLNTPPPNGDEKFLSLAIEGNFQIGRPLQFTLLNNDNSLVHTVDYGDNSTPMKFKNTTKHVYRRPGEYQIKFYPNGDENPVVETILIKRKSNTNDAKFEKVIVEEEAKKAKKAFVNAAYDKNASFPGGTTALMAYLQTHIGNVSGYEGRVIVSFIVKSDGSVADIKISDSINSKLDNQVLAAFDGIPKWDPAIREGIKIDSEYQLPFYFKKDI